MRVARSTLEQKIQKLTEATGKDFFFDWGSGRCPRLCMAVNGDRMCSRYITPRLTGGKMLQWLESFEAGLAYSGANKMRDALNSAPPPPSITDQSPRTAELLLQWMAEYRDWYDKRGEALSFRSHNEVTL
ncbi:MAG: hypothetical protein ACWGQW_06905 [bacterium]